MTHLLLLTLAVAPFLLPSGACADDRPITGAPTNSTPELTPLSEPEKAPVDYFLLFKREGATQSVATDFGYMKQPEVGGKMLSGQYTYGWWAWPWLITSLAVRGGITAETTYAHMMVNVGPHLKFRISRRWFIAGYAGYGMSQGLSLVPAQHLPPAPGHYTLRARHGPIFGGQLMYFFWPKRDLAIGPTLSAFTGYQDERNQTLFTAGVTFQFGRPNYTGDLTDR